MLSGKAIMVQAESNYMMTPEYWEERAAKSMAIARKQFFRMLADKLNDEALKGSMV